MSNKKVSHLLHRRINELLDQILANESEQKKNEHPRLNLGNQDQQFLVSMESFFEFNFDFSKELDGMIEAKLLDVHQREWSGDSEDFSDHFADERNANEYFEHPRRPK